MPDFGFYIDAVNDHLYHGSHLVSDNEKVEQLNLKFIEMLLFGPEDVRCLITRHHSSRQIQLEERRRDQLQTTWDKTFKQHLTFNPGFLPEDFSNGYCWTIRVWRENNGWYLVFTEHH